MFSIYSAYKKQSVFMGFIMLKRKFLAAASVLFLTANVFADPTVSVFVKDASEMQEFKTELENLKAGIGNDNAELNALWEEANKIAEMNDRCATIQLNEALDESCSHFYSVELPEFETKYMKVTGEVRLSAVKVASTLEERTEQITACTKAFASVIVSKEQLLKLDGSVDLEPTGFDGSFDATYNFSFYFDKNRIEQQKQMAELWLEKCQDVILRKSGDEFAPLFLESVKNINDSLAQTKTNLKIVVNPEKLHFYLDLNRNVSGSYHLNGAKLFQVDSIPSGKDNSHLLVNMKKRKIFLPLSVDAPVQNFKGRRVFKTVYQDKDLVGRWMWRNAKSKPEPDVVVPAPAELAAQDTAKKEEPKPVVEPKKDGQPTWLSTHWIPLAASGAVIVGGTVMAILFDSKASSLHDEKPKDKADMKKHVDDMESAQNMRMVGFGVAILGAVGLGLTFVF